MFNSGIKSHEPHQETLTVYQTVYQNLILIVGGHELVIYEKLEVAETHEIPGELLTCP